MTFDMSMEIHGLGLKSVELEYLRICFLFWIKLPDGSSACSSGHWADLTEPFKHP